MERNIFEERLRDATERAIMFARELVLDELPDSVLYLIRPNSSYDGNPLVGDEELFPEDSLPPGQNHLPPISAGGVVDFLWRRGGKVPEWVDLGVHKVDRKHTFVSLLCCGRYTAGEYLYHRAEGVPPFHILSPPTPCEWLRLTTEEAIARHGKFRLQSKRYGWY